MEESLQTKTIRRRHCSEEERERERERERESYLLI